MQSQVIESAGTGAATQTVSRLDVAWVYRLAVGALMLASLGLRVFGIGWGIPDFDPARLQASAYRNSYHIDEDNFIWGLMQMRPAQGRFDVGDYHWGTLQFYLIYGTLLGGEAVGVLPSPWEDAFRQGDIPVLPKIYILGRLVSVAAGVLGTLVVLALGTLLAGRAAGFMAGAAYAVAPLAVTEGHYLTNDVVMSVLVAASVLCAALAVRRGSARWLIIAGLLLGLGVSDKYSAIFAAPALLVAQLLYWRARSGVQRRESLPVAFLVPWLAAIAGFLVGEPYALIAPAKVIAGLQIVEQSNGPDAYTGIGRMASMLGWQAENIAGLALTWPLALLSLGGLGLLAWRAVRALTPGRDEAPVRLQFMAPPLVVLMAIVCLGASLALNRVPVIRYSQPLLPLLAVAAGVAWAALSPVWLRWSAGVIAFGVAAVITLGQLSIMVAPHPANDLLAWLQSHSQPGETIAQVWPEYPPLDGGSYKLIRIDPWNPQLPAGARPDYVIMDDMAFAPPSPALAGVLAHDYHEVARFGARPHIGPFAWDEGTTPHDWKYSHPTFTVYALLK